MDNVNHPAHYNTGKYESIDVMVETQGVNAVKNFCICNAFKYIYRHRFKNGAEDIKKAIWYLNKYIELNELTTDEFEPKLVDKCDVSSIEPKHGEWIHDTAEVSEFREMLLPNCRCSVCGCGVQCETNFCPNCGTDMRKREDK